MRPSGRTHEPRSSIRSRTGWWPWGGVGRVAPSESTPALPRPHPCSQHLCPLAVLELLPFTINWESSLCLDPASGQVPCFLLGNYHVKTSSPKEHRRTLASFASTSRTSETTTACNCTGNSSHTPMGPRQPWKISMQKRQDSWHRVAPLKKWLES